MIVNAEIAIIIFFMAYGLYKPFKNKRFGQNEM